MENILKEINKLKKKRKAVILAHNYQRPEVQDAADFVGDSLQLAQEAKKTKARLIVFCGVDFMAETAAILNPDKIVVMPDKNARCPMAKMINEEKLLDLKKKHPKAKVVCYINSSAGVKSLSDICCTSSNALKIVNSLNVRKIIFIPDKYLGEWTARKSGKKFIFFNGYCPTHMKFSANEIKKLKKKYPKAIVLCHPECRPEIKKVSDFVLSTGGMISLVKENPAREFIIATEEGILHQMRKQNPKKKFYHASNLAVCPNMKKTDLYKILDSLKDIENHKIIVPKNVAKKAIFAIEKMIEYS